MTEGPEDSGMIDIRDARDGPERPLVPGPRRGRNDVAFSPDGSRLATTGDDGKLKVWDSSTGRLVSSLAAVGEGVGPSFSADGSLVAAAGRGEWARSWTVHRPVGLDDPRARGAIDTALSPDGRYVGRGQTQVGADEVGAVFDMTTGEQAFALAGPNSGSPVLGPRGRGDEEDTRGVAWSPDGRLIAGSGEGTARVWDAETGTVRHTLLGHTGFVFGVAWSPDSSRLVTGGSDGTTKVWEIGPEGVQERWSLSAQESKSGIVGVAFSPDGSRVMAGDANLSAVRVWDLGPTGDAEWANLPAPGYPGAEFMPDGRRVVTSSWEGGVEQNAEAPRAVTIWDLQTGREIRTIGPPTDYFGFGRYDVSPDGSSIALGGRSEPEGFGGASAARAWDASTGEELWRIGHVEDVNEVAFSPDGEYVARELEGNREDRRPLRPGDPGAGRA